MVIPNHNYARFVGDAVESVLAQTYRSVELIVVDDGSSDGSLGVLAAYESRCRIIQQQALGQSAARNRGVNEARGDFIAFLDADDVWRPQKLEQQMRLFEQDPATALVYCSVELADEQLRATGRSIKAAARGEALNEFVRWPGRAVVVGGESTAVVARDALEAVGPFDTALSVSAGWDVWRRIATRYPIDYVPDELVIVRQHGSNASRRLNVYEADVRAAAARMFADPAARRIHRFRRNFESHLDLTFARAWLRAGDVRRASLLFLRGSALRALSPAGVGAP